MEQTNTPQENLESITLDNSISSTQNTYKQPDLNETSQILNTNELLNSTIQNQNVSVNQSVDNQNLSYSNIANSTTYNYEHLNSSHHTSYLNQNYSQFQNQFNQTSQSYKPDTSVYARGYNQVQSYPYSNYQNYNQQSNYNYPNISQAYPPQFNTSNYSQAFNQFNYRQQNAENNHFLNSSLHQPNPMAMIDSLSRSFNGVPSNIPMMYPQFHQGYNNNPSNNFNMVINNFIKEYYVWFENYKKEYNSNTKKAIPLKFEKNHSSVNFGNSNQLITVSGKSIIIHNIKSKFIEYGENTLINTWPGPLIKDQNNKSEIIEYIRGQEKVIDTINLPEYQYFNLEKSQIWQLLSLMIKQNGEVSSSELAEFLISKNESDFINDDGGQEMSKFRRYLLLGQKKNALDFANKVGLWGHRFTLAYLMSNSSLNDLMVNSILDFTDSTLSNIDPVFILYRQFLQNLQKNAGYEISTKVLTPFNLQQFTVLLANDCKLNPTISGSVFESEVLKLLVAIRDSKSHYINLNSIQNFFLKNIIKPNDQTYCEEILFMNEVYEFCQKPNLPNIELIPYKVIFASKLFDYGLIDQSRKYCDFIRNVFKTSLRFNCFDEKKMRSINWELVMYIIDIIESKIDKVLSDTIVTNSFGTTPISNSSRLESSPRSCTEENYDESEQNELISNQLDSELEELNLNSDIPNPLKIQSKVNPMANNNLNFLNSNKIMPNFDRQMNIKEPSVQRQATRTISQSSNFSNFSNQNEKEVLKKEISNNSINKKNLDLQNSQKSIQAKNTFNENNFNQQPQFFIPNFSPNDNLPPLDFISKPPIEPVNLLEKKDDELIEKKNIEPESNTASLGLNINNQKDLFQPPFSNPSLNSTLNVHPTSQQNQNYAFSPAVSPITSPSIDSLSRNKSMKNDERNQFTKDERNQFTKDVTDNLNIANGDQIDSAAKNKDKSTGIFTSLNSWVSKIRPKTNEAHLPDDTVPRFVYDEKLGKWIDKEKDDDNSDPTEELIRQGPPKMMLSNQNLSSNQSVSNNLSNNMINPPPMIDPSQFSFTKSKQKRYVDILQQ